MNVTAIVLAAGTSSRMGQPKQLLQYEGTSLVRRAAQAALASRAKQTIVVTGAARSAVEAELSGLAVRVEHNPDYAQGMSTSLRVGLNAVRPEVDAVVVLLADQPFIDASIVDRLLDLYERSGSSIVRPRYGNVPGNPVLWDRSRFAELLEQTGDQGGRALLQQYRHEIAWLELPDAALQTDVDTPEAYAALTGATPAPPVAPAASNGAAPSEQPAGAKETPTTAEETPTSPADSGHPHLGGYRFCPRCATPLVVKPISYDQNREHPACPACDFVVWNDPKVAVLTVVPWADGILLGRRGQQPGQGQWSFPSGFVDRGEVCEAAARRETKEETGLDVDITGLIGVYSSAGKPVIVIAYAAEVRGGTLLAEEDLTDLAGFPPDALPEMAFPHDTQIVQDWQGWRARVGTAMQTRRVR
ncbi:MAG: NTP transferase domain-containing protein [Chloroflexi bacterium]|nr:NTP transferase domain-containing protein [Chloroflexota bacterium]